MSTSDGGIIPKCRVRLNGGRTMKMGKILVAGVVVTLALAACQEIKAVYLRHPETKHVVECQSYRPLNIGTAQVRLAQQRGCIEDYRAQGYLRVPPPSKIKGADQ